MNYYSVNKTDLKPSRMILGCMRLAQASDKDAASLVNTALDAGVNIFDLADIYESGESERTLGRVLQFASFRRDDIYIQTKCGIRNGCYDLSGAYIVRACEASLKRLGVEYVDILLLHRPDALMVPDEVAEAFDRLFSAGKVRYFGVSNCNTAQFRLLSGVVHQPLVTNQIQLSLAHADSIAAGMSVNTGYTEAADRDGALMAYAQMNHLLIQAWSPLQYGMFQGTFLGSEHYAELNATLDDIAKQHAVSSAAVAIAWLLRHPVSIQPILGTINPKHLRQALQGDSVTLSREEWYRLYIAAGYPLP